MTPVQHFLKRAQEARALANLGRDIYLSRSLLQVAQELEEEAAMMAAGVMRDRRSSPRVGISGAVAILRPVNPTGGSFVGRLLDISLTGARVAIAAHVTTDTQVMLELPCGGFLIPARVARAMPNEAGLAFDNDPLTRASVSEVTDYFAREQQLISDTDDPEENPVAT